MSMPQKENLLAFNGSNKQHVESLFGSEAYFWLTTAVATSFALEEIKKHPDAAIGSCAGGCGAALGLFNKSIRQDRIQAEDMAKAQEWALENIRKINAWSHQTLVFQPKQSLVLSKSFISYWLFFKLIEIEWQEVLDLAEVEDTYLFLDGVIADEGELAAIEATLSQEAPLDDDQNIYLRIHWQRAQVFWSILQAETKMLAAGIVSYQVIQ